MKQATCRCEMTVEIDAPDIIDPDSDATSLSSLSEGKSPSAICPRCGAVVRAELPLRIISAVRGIDIVVLSELERLSVYRGKASDTGTGEILLGYQELFERARMLKDGRDPKVLETLKFLLQGKAEEAEPDAEITILYNGTSNGALEFHVLGMKSGQTGVIKLQESTYSRRAQELKAMETKEPYASIFNGRYRSIKKLGFLDSM